MDGTVCSTKSQSDHHCTHNVLCCWLAWLGVGGVVWGAWGAAAV